MKNSQVITTTLPSPVVGDLVSIDRTFLTLIETNPRIYAAQDGACYKPFGNDNYLCVAAPIHSEN